MKGQKTDFPFWIDRFYDETMDLLIQAKFYSNSPGRRAIKYDPPERCLHVSKEALRVTARLTHTMAWVLSEKAVLCHEITREEQIAENRPLSEETTCTKECDDLDGFPKGLITLMDESLNLFLRASRLEAKFRD